MRSPVGDGSWLAMISFTLPTARSVSCTAIVCLLLEEKVSPRDIIPAVPFLMLYLSVGCARSGAGRGKPGGRRPLAARHVRWPRKHLPKVWNIAGRGRGCI